jgi:uncharacterized protein (DUF433 family)
MLPDLDDNGNIPQGIHRASLAEIEQRFGCASEVRRAEMQSLRWLVELAKRAGVRRLVIGGSFITEVLEPNDLEAGGSERAVAAGDPALPLARVSVRRIAGWYKLGWSAEEISRRIGHSSLAQVHAALACCHGNQEAMEAEMAAEEEEADRLEREHRAARAAHAVEGEL